jgi:hypothetical protein
MFIEKENSVLAFNQVISMYSFNEKNMQTLLKHMQLYSALAGLDTFKFDNSDKMVAFTLDKFVDAKQQG